MRIVYFKLFILALLPLLMACNLKADISELTPTTGAAPSLVTSELQGVEFAPAGKQKMLSTPASYAAQILTGLHLAQATAYARRWPNALR